MESIIYRFRNFGNTGHKYLTYKNASVCLPLQNRLTGPKNFAAKFQQEFLKSKIVQTTIY